MTKYLFLGSLLGLAACDGGIKDSGDTGMGGDTADTADTAETGDTDTGETGSTDTFDSCNWPDQGICYEFMNYDGTDQWCTDIGATYGFTTEYSAETCATGSIGVCDLPAGGDFPVEATAYYYSPNTETDAQGNCDAAGGTWGG